MLERGIITGRYRLSVTDIKITLLKDVRTQAWRISGSHLPCITPRAGEDDQYVAGALLSLQGNAEYIGRLMSDLTQAKASFEPPETTGTR